MPTASEPTARVFERTYELGRARHGRPAWWRIINRDLLFGLLLIAVAIGVHFTCYQWRPLGWDDSPSLHNPYDHAGGISLSLSPEDAPCNLASAFWWGVFMPVLLGIVGMLFVLRQPLRFW
jgi:hypothetical protein